MEEIHCLYLHRSREHSTSAEAPIWVLPENGRIPPPSKTGMHPSQSPHSELDFRNLLIKRAMNHYCDKWVQEWCNENGWTDLFKERFEYWAFPPNAVMPLPIPQKALRLIKQQRGMSADERLWCFSAIATAAVAAFSSYFLLSPMPLVGAFAFCAVTVARLEPEDA